MAMRCGWDGRANEVETGDANDDVDDSIADSTKELKKGAEIRPSFNSLD